MSECELEKSQEIVLLGTLLEHLNSLLVRAGAFEKEQEKVKDVTSSENEALSSDVSQDATSAHTSGLSDSHPHDSLDADSFITEFINRNQGEYQNLQLFQLF